MTSLMMPFLSVGIPGMGFGAAVGAAVGLGAGVCAAPVATVMANRMAPKLATKRVFIPGQRTLAQAGSTTVRLAATVMLVRPSGERGFEVFMLRRSSASTFAPGAFVFPGGTIDPQDERPEARATTFGLDDARLETEFRS